MKILLVDDSRFVRNTVKRHINNLNYTDITFLDASNGIEALKLFEKEKPKLVFLDLLMPEVGGEEVLKEIRKKNDSCYVVVLTSNIQKFVKERVLSAGANLFIDKTITFEKVTEIMENYESSKNA